MKRQSPDTALSQQANDRRRRRSLVVSVSVIIGGLLILGMVVGSHGMSISAFADLLSGDQAQLILTQIRAPRTVGALLVGALLGLAGAIAQGVFRNPLADPYLLGSAAGASLAVVLVFSAGALNANLFSALISAWLEQVGIVVAAFTGALIGVLLTLSLARGAQETIRLLLAGVVVTVVLGAISDLITNIAPDALRGKQSFMLGNTVFLSWHSVMVLSIGLIVAMPIAYRLSRVLDALTLGEESAASLGLALPRLRMVLILLLALCTGLAVSQSGLVAFVGLVSPHLVRRFAPAPQAFTLVASAAVGGALLLGADVIARAIIAPQELPVGILTAILGGSYLLWLLHRRSIST